MSALQGIFFKVAATRAAATEGRAERNEISWRNEGNKAAVKLTEEREKKTAFPAEMRSPRRRHAFTSNTVWPTDA